MPNQVEVEIPGGVERFVPRDTDALNQYAAGVSCPCGFNMPLISRKPIPKEDLERASRYAVERGWVKSRAEGS